MNQSIIRFFLALITWSITWCAYGSTPTAEHRGDIMFASQQCNGSVSEPTATLVTRQEQLDQIYQQLQSNSLGSRHPVPVMDFNKNTILFMEMGQQRTGGYQLAFDSRKPIQVFEDYVGITVTWLEPDKNTVTTQVMTTPCVLVRFAAGNYSAVRVFDQHGKQRYPANP